MKSQNRKTVRLIDVAQAAGVSRVAVGQVLNRSGGSNVRVSEETRRRVLDIARKLNYRPNRIAQQLRGGRTKMLGVILDTMHMPVMYNRLSALERAASARGYRLVIGQVHADPAGVGEYLEDFEGRGVDGVICLFDLMRGRDKAVAPLFDGVEHVVFHGRPVYEGASVVRVDTTDAIRQAMAHLFERGRKRPGLVLWNLDDELCDYRRAGFTEGYAAAGVTLDEGMIWEGRHTSQTPSQEVLDDVIDKLIVGKKADAIVAPNDEWAVRLMQKLKSRGFKVPGDVALVGYDNLEIADVIEPGLTTIDQQHDLYAAAALDLLIGGIEEGKKKGESRRVTIKPKLIVRQST
ncbi:MAG: LacI family DNA-binding transcriptional regulator [Planctomycetes bacterium]|nr:LacI family DNA-binding transcriptional regulator [Planctomycetota bacterium]